MVFGLYIQSELNNPIRVIQLNIIKKGHGLIDIDYELSNGIKGSHGISEIGLLSAIEAYYTIDGETEYQKLQDNYIPSPISDFHDSEEEGIIYTSIDEALSEIKKRLIDHHSRIPDGAKSLSSCIRIYPFCFLDKSVLRIDKCVMSSQK